MNPRPFLALSDWLAKHQQTSLGFRLAPRTGLICAGAGKSLANVSALVSTQPDAGLFSGTDRLPRVGISSGAS